MKFRIAMLAAAFALLACAGPLVSHAQTADSQKALQSLKESMDTLVGAKDDNNPNDAVFRIETFKKVISFSVTEAQNLKVKLIAATDKEKATTTLAWRDAAVARISDALGFYDTESAYLAANPDMTTDEIKALADQFKAWRESTYIPLSDEVTDFLLIQQEDKALATTDARWQKVSDDISKLDDAYGAQKVQPLTDLLAGAASSTAAANNLNAEAFSLFGTTYIDPLFSTSTPVTATSTAESADATSTAAATSTDAIAPAPSIRDLVKQSLAKVKETYQTFIDMSALVKKLFG